MNDRLYIQLMKTPRANLIALMMMSLDEMQSFNGRSRGECIRLVLDCELELRKDGRSFWRIPSIRKIKEATNNWL